MTILTYCKHLPSYWHPTLGTRNADYKDYLVYQWQVPEIIPLGVVGGFIAIVVLSSRNISQPMTTMSPFAKAA